MTSITLYRPQPNYPEHSYEVQLRGIQQPPDPLAPDDGVWFRNVTATFQGVPVELTMAEEETGERMLSDTHGANP
jgi:hypothetical protein